MTSKNNREIGAAGENTAAAYLLENNYTILETNFRAGRIGEIDIIARDSEYICFIEVKTRRSYNYGTPGEAVNLQKQKKIRRLAEIYLSRTCKTGSCVRFDVVEIIMDNARECSCIKKINLIKNAF